MLDRVYLTEGWLRNIVHIVSLILRRETERQLSHALLFLSSWDHRRKFASIMLPLTLLAATIRHLWEEEALSGALREGRSISTITHIFVVSLLECERFDRQFIDLKLVG